jgi:hypothetical protein
MKKNPLTTQVSQIMKKTGYFPIDLVEIKIIQSLLSSKLPSMNRETIEKVLNTVLHHIKNNLGKHYEKLELIAYRIDTTSSNVLSIDYIQHRLILLGNDFIKKIPTLKESLNSYVKSKMGDTLSIYIREKQQSEEIYTFFINQPSNTSRKQSMDHLSDKTNNFYHPDLYEFSKQGWLILYPKEIMSSFVILK